MDDPFFPFPLQTDGKGSRLLQETDEQIRHEVLFESGVTAIRDRPLFVGSAFPRRRFTFFCGFALLLCLVLFARAAFMLLQEGAVYVKLAEANRLRQTPLWPLRGIVRDREGKILAENAPRFQATLFPRDLPIRQEDKDAALGEAARLFGKSYADLRSIGYATGTVQDEVNIVADDIPYEQAMKFAVALPHLPGFNLETRARRQYPWSEQAPSLSHVLGYVGKISQEEYEGKKDRGYRRADEIGKTGIERFYEPELRGELGERVNEVDAHGVIKAFVGEQTPKDGEDLSLTLDLSLQIAAEEALKTGLARVHKTRGSVVVSDPRDGSILALVSWPAFDNNAFSGSVSSTLYQNLVHNQDQPLFPRAMAGSYPSGSTVKIVISAAALTEGIITPFTTVLSVGGIRLGAWFFPDWKVGGHGITNVRKAIAQSVNTFFYTIGGGYQGFQGLGADRLSAWMKRFGLGEKTGIDLAAEVSGSVPTRAERERGGGQWYVGDTYNLSIGQGDLLVTPLQVNSYTSIIANGGYRYVPHVVANPHPSFTEVGATDEAYKVVREGMRDCVTGGSCRTVSFLPFPVSAKTGTAQWNSNKETHAWFTAYGSSEHPEVAVTVLVEEGGEGSVASAPVAREVLDAWYRLRQARGGKF